MKSELTKFKTHGPYSGIVSGTELSSVNKGAEPVTSAAIGNQREILWGPQNSTQPPPPPHPRPLNSSLALSRGVN